MGPMMTAYHVPNLTGAELPHHRSAQSRCPLSAVTPPRLAERSLNDHMDPSSVLRDLGIIVLGHVDPALVERVRTHSESLSTTQSRYQRQTELQWNGDCDAVFEYFETVSGRVPLPGRSLL